MPVASVKTWEDQPPVSVQWRTPMSASGVPVPSSVTVPAMLPVTGAATFGWASKKSSRYGVAVACQLWPQPPMVIIDTSIPVGQPCHVRTVVPPPPPPASALGPVQPSSSAHCCIRSGTAGLGSTLPSRRLPSYPTASSAVPCTVATATVPEPRQAEVRFTPATGPMAANTSAASQPNVVVKPPPLEWPVA